MTAIVLLGPPGAGKGTVAEILVEQGFEHVSTGELLREQIRLKTKLGLEAAQLIEKGLLVPDGVVVGMIHSLFDRAEKGKKFLFDGFPRTLAQAIKLDELIAAVGGTLSDVILLECEDEVIIKRLSGRRTCEKCGTVYHITYNAPASGDVCDVDGGRLKQRSDDAVDTIQKRLDIYAERTAPLIGYYRDKGLVHVVDATLSIAEVRAAVFERVGK